MWVCQSCHFAQVCSTLLVVLAHFLPINFKSLTAEKCHLIMNRAHRCVVCCAHTYAPWRWQTATENWSLICNCTRAGSNSSVAAAIRMHTEREPQLGWRIYRFRTAVPCCALGMSFILLLFAVNGMVSHENRTASIDASLFRCHFFLCETYF